MEALCLPSLYCEKSAQCRVLDNQPSTAEGSDHVMRMVVDVCQTYELKSYSPFFPCTNLDIEEHLVAFYLGGQ